MDNGGWEALQLWQEKAKVEGRDMEEFILNTIHVNEVYMMAREIILRAENYEM